MTIDIRLYKEEEASILAAWIAQPDDLRWFPMTDQREIDDAVKVWAGYARMGASFTAEYDGQIAGMAILYIQPYKKMAHHCLFAIIVNADYRNRGIGKALIEHFEKVARDQFHIEILHLEVYENNPAIHLYERLGFKEYGRHPRFIKENGKYVCKILMQKETGLGHGRA